jgi:hypothetical protein
MVKDKATNYMPNEYWDFSKSGKENAEKYLKMCAENNKRPKFYKLLDYDGNGTYSLKKDGSTDGYWKLLIDFKMYDNNGKGSPQTPVIPRFNMEESTKMLDEYKGGHEKYPIAYDVVDKFVEQYNRDNDTRYSHKALEKLDADYLSAVERGDTETAQRMVDEAARKWSNGNEIVTTDAETGEVLYKFYRSADGGRTVWNGHGNNKVKGVFLTSGEHIANAFDPEGKHISVYAKAKNPFEIDAKGKIYTGIPVDENAPEWLQDIAGYDVVYNDEIGDYVTEMSADIDLLYPAAWEQGYDAVIVTNVKEGVGGGLATTSF